MEKPTIVGTSKVNRVIVNAVLQDADVKNRNRRVYPKGTISNGLNSEYVRERISTKTFYGEAGHPLKPDIQRQLYMDQSNISHRINKFWWEGNVLRGEIEAANTARGQDFDGVIRQESKVGFSLRAVGPITEKRGDITVVKDPLTIFCYDWVIHPSHASAYMTDIISESGNVINESAGIFMPVYAEEAIDYIKSQSKNFKMIAECFELDSKEIFLSEDSRKVYVKNGQDTVAIFTEDYIAGEVSRYMSKIKG